MEGEDMNFSEDRPIYLQIMDYIIQEILQEHLKSGEKVLAVREMALEMTTNPNTVQRALQELERLKILYSVRGKGRFVTNDQEVLIALKKSKKEEIAKEYLIKMERIGFSNREAIEEIKHFIEEKENGND